MLTVSPPAAVRSGWLKRAAAKGNEMKIGEKLRKIRKRYNWTLKTVSQRTELSIGYLSDIERGRTNPSLEACQKLADNYLMNLSQLFKDVA